MPSPFRLVVGKEDRIIRGDVYTAESAGDFPLPVLILCHGFKGFKDWGFFPIVASKIAESGYVVITYNSSMNGIGEDLESFTELDKFGRLTYSREQEDLSLVWNSIAEGLLPHADKMKTDDISLFGHSRGGANVLIYALDHPEHIQKVIVWNSVPRVDFFPLTTIQDAEEEGVGYVIHARTGQQLPIYREVLDDIEEHYERFLFLKRLPQLQSELLIVQGDDDLTGFYESAEKMAELAPKAQFHVIEEGNHTFSATHPFTEIPPQLEEAIQTTLAFLSE